MDEMIQRFQRAFNTIERQLRLISNSGQRQRFYELIDSAAQKNTAVCRCDRVLRKFGDLRNLLTHDNQDLAVPSKRLSGLRRLQRLSQVRPNSSRYSL